MDWPADLIIMLWQETMCRETRNNMRCTCIRWRRLLPVIPNPPPFDWPHKNCYLAKYIHLDKVRRLVAAKTHWKARADSHGFDWQYAAMERLMGRHANFWLSLPFPIPDVYMAYLYGSKTSIQRELINIFEPRNRQGLKGEKVLTLLEQYQTDPETFKAIQEKCSAILLRATLFPSLRAQST